MTRRQLKYKGTKLRYMITDLRIKRLVYTQMLIRRNKPAFANTPFYSGIKAVFMIARSALGNSVNYKTGYTSGGHMEKSPRTYLYF